MATLLEYYQKKNEDYHSQMAEDSFPPDDILALQEMNYRICVLDTFQSMLWAAPVTTDMQVLGKHYQVISAYMELLLKERKFGPKMDETQKQKRDTALSSLENVVKDGKKRFMSFTASTPNCYKETIKNYCRAVLTVWMQYRETYINLQGGCGL